MRKLLLACLLALALGAVLVAPATAATTTALVLDEQIVAYSLDDHREPGLGAGDVFHYTAVLTDPATGAVAGTKTGTCTTDRILPNGDSFGRCDATITLAGGTILTAGDFDTTAFEHAVPQTQQVVGGTGAYAYARGTEVLQQTRYPDQTRLTITLT